MGGWPITSDERCFVLDDSQLPIVRMIFPRVGNHKSIDDNMQNMLAIAYLQPIVILGDSRPLDVKTVTPKLRRHFFEKTNEFYELCGHHILGEAALMSRWVEQHFYQVYLWMRKDRGCPTKAFRNEAEAVAWCLEVARHSKTSAVR